MSEATKADEIVMLPPYVEPKHRQLIERAELMLDEYNEILLSRIKDSLFKCGESLKPRPDDLRKAERLFHEDPVRAYLIKQLGNIKAMCEKPRFMVKANQAHTDSHEQS